MIWGRNTCLAGDSQLSVVLEESVSLILISPLAWADRERFTHELDSHLDGEMLPATLGEYAEPGQFRTRIASARGPSRARVSPGSPREPISDDRALLTDCLVTAACDT